MKTVPTPLLFRPPDENLAPIQQGY